MKLSLRRSWKGASRPDPGAESLSGGDAADTAQQSGRDMTRAAFTQAMTSGRSPGAAALLAELERGWAREDARNDRSRRPHAR
jgi:hypothetical protein